MNLKRGSTFLHRFWLDVSKAPAREPLRCRVTKVSGGSVYWRADYGKHDDGTEWLGSPMRFQLDDASRYVRPESLS